MYPDLKNRGTHYLCLFTFQSNLTRMLYYFVSAPVDGALFGVFAGFHFSALNNLVLSIYPWRTNVF